MALPGADLKLDCPSRCSRGKDELPEPMQEPGRDEVGDAIVYVLGFFVKLSAELCDRPRKRLGEYDAKDEIVVGGHALARALLVVDVF
jgi:hypothetical protein